MYFGILFESELKFAAKFEFKHKVEIEPKFEFEPKVEVQPTYEVHCSVLCIWSNIWNPIFEGDQSEWEMENVLETSSKPTVNMPICNQVFFDLL